MLYQGPPTPTSNINDDNSATNPPYQAAQPQEEDQDMSESARTALSVTQIVDSVSATSSDEYDGDEEEAEEEEFMLTEDEEREQQGLQDSIVASATPTEHPSSVQAAAQLQERNCLPPPITLTPDFNAVDRFYEFHSSSSSSSNDDISPYQAPEPRAPPPSSHYQENYYRSAADASAFTIPPPTMWYTNPAPVLGAGGVGGRLLSNCSLAERRARARNILDTLNEAFEIISDDDF